MVVCVFSNYTNDTYDGTCIIFSMVEEALILYRLEYCTLYYSSFNSMRPLFGDDSHPDASHSILRTIANIYSHT